MSDGRVITNNLNIGSVEFGAGKDADVLLNDRK